MQVSIFNDVIGPVMRGPSSSHCAAALRIGRLARDLMAGDFDSVLVQFDRHGSLPTTHESQGSDMGLFGGLLGWDAADERLPRAAEALREAGIRVCFETVDTRDPHPNTYRLTLANARERHSLVAVSTGGGMVEVLQIDGSPVSIHGDYYETLLRGDLDAIQARLQGIDADFVLRDGEMIRVKSGRFLEDDLVCELQAAGIVDWARFLHPVLPVLSRPSTRVPFTTCAEMLAWDAGREAPLWSLALEYEAARGDLGKDEVLRRMVELVRILRRSIAHGLAGTSYEDRVLGYQSGGFRECLETGRLLDAGALNRIILYVTSLMEVKSSMGVIIAMPTAGACAALPGAVIGMAEAMGLGEEDMARALLAAGMVGVIFATRWTFAAEVGGCQAEGGAAACMAAAGLVSLAGGSLKQSVAASSMALQSMIGLICDPVANRVEVPCLGKNVMAAANALCCANMALAGFDPVIPLDEVIETAKRVAEQMPRELRCTNLGGLSITPTALRLERELALRSSCGACACRGGGEPDPPVSASAV